MGTTAEEDTLLELALTQLPMMEPHALALSATIRPQEGGPTYPAGVTVPRLSVVHERERERDPGTGAIASESRSDYSIVDVLGEGGMGRVLLARQHSLSRDVAIKTLKPDASRVALRAIVREARLTGALEHPGIIPVHAFGLDEEGQPLLVMKRVAGVDLATLLADHAHLAWGERGAEGDRVTACLEILMQVCQTVEFAHRRGVIHRDIKPENVMVGELGEVYLVDWGIAVSTSDETAPGQLVGTLAYMAPEMARGAVPDARTDVYLLGATLHEILTGERRHSGSTLRDVLRSAVVSAPVVYGADVPDELATLMNRAMHRDPAARCPSAREFRRELADFLRHRGARALSDAASERLEELTRSVDDAEGRPPSDLAAAYRLANEARFGFAQALREHPESAAAQAGARRVVETLIEIEMRQEHPESALALLAELSDAPPGLVERIATLQRRIAERARNQARWSSMERELDPSVNVRARTFVYAALGTCVAFAGAVGLVRGERATTPKEMVWTALLALALLSTAVALLKKRVLSTAFNRRGVGLLLFAVVAAVGNRAIGFVCGAPVEAIFALEMFIGALLYAVGGLTLLPRIAWSAPILVLGVVVAVAWPAHAVLTYNIATLAGLACVSLVFVRSRPTRVD